MIDIDETQSWHKVKVTRSKVKVKFTIMWKYWLAYKTQTEGWILIKLTGMIDINIKIVYKWSQGQKVKGQGQTWSYEKNVFALVNHEEMIES